MDNTSLETSFYWLSDDRVRFRIKVGVEEMYKNVTVISRKAKQASTAAMTS